jgi:hypothetical protein
MQLSVRKTTVLKGEIIPETCEKQGKWGKETPG